ncbi:hypothetical protein ACJMK2_028548 [Sinanodonta woodiana]|uniref:CUB domain-containing protein n=1 Tax=Sinanodonta woodiana TaxID=1069815 RepID=A0ABD3X8Z5_SINWO
MHAWVCVRVCVILDFNVAFLISQDLMDEFLFQHNSCYGSNRDYSIVNANCSADNVIAVSRVQAGVKFNNSSCPVVLHDNTTVDFENCCKIIADDCVINVSTTNWHALCSGNESCVSAPAVSVPSNCTPMFRANTSNMQLDYYCINITRIGSTCTQVAMTTSENALYLWNAGYSTGVNADTDCVCSIQVESCDAHIEVTAMRIDLEDDNGTCIQNITFSDSLGNPEMAIDCSKQYDISPLFTSKTNYISMNFVSDRNNTLGKYWIRFKATDAKSDLHVDCNPAEQHTSCRTTSTKTSSSTTTTTTTQKTTTTKTRTPPTTAAPTITAPKSSTTTRTTDTQTSEEPTSDNDDASNYSTTMSVNSTPTPLLTATPYISPTTTENTSATTSTTVTPRFPSPQTFESSLTASSVSLSPIITDSDNVIVIPPTTRTSTPTTETTFMTITTPSPTRPPTSPSVRSVITSDQPPLCACSYCGHPGKHYHPIASCAGKYSKKKHFRCRYCGIFWEKTTNLPFYSPCTYMSNQY